MKKHLRNGLISFVSNQIIDNIEEPNLLREQFPY